MSPACRQRPRGRLHWHDETEAATSGGHREGGRRPPPSVVALLTWDPSIGIVLLALGALAILSVVGFGVLSFVTSSLQTRLLPAVPLLGAAVFVVALHWTGLVLGARWGLPIVLALGAVLVVVQGFRGRFDIGALRRGLPGLAIALAVGAVGTFIVWLPLLHSGGAQLVQPTDSYDSFYYVSTSRWLTDNPYVSVPHQATAPGPDSLAPIFGPAATSISIGLRLGQELLQAGLAGLLGVSSVQSFIPLIGVWVLLVPGGVWVIGSTFRVPAWFRSVIGLASVVSLSLVGQALASNADSLLGVALVPLVIALFAAGVCSSGADRPPLVLVALALAALVGTYTEYGPFVVPVLAAVAVIAERRGYGRRIVRTLAVVALAVLINPVIWWRAVRSLAVTGGVAATPAGQSGVAARLERLLGPFETAIHGWQGGAGAAVQAAGIILMLVGLLVGVVLGLRRLETRGMSVGLLAALGVAVVLALGGNDYVTGRASGMVLPLLIVGAGIGWAGSFPRTLRGWGAHGSRTRWRLLGLTGVAVFALFIVLNGRASATVAAQPVSPRFTLDAAFDQAAGWVERFGGPDGREVSVATASLFDQLWISDRLGAESDVSYISLRSDLGYRGRLPHPQFWNGSLDRYVLVGPGAYFMAPPSAIVRQNARFALIDTQADRGRAVIVVPVQQAGHLYWVVDDRNGVTGIDRSAVVVLSGAGTAAGADLEFRDGRPHERVELVQGADGVATTVADDGTATVPLSGTRFDNGVARMTVRVSPEGALTIAGMSSGR